MSKKRNELKYTIEVEEGRCSVCKGDIDQVGVMVGFDGGINVCSRCSQVLMMEHEKNSGSIRSNKKRIKKDTSGSGKYQTPAEILNELNVHIIGQERTKKILAVAAVNHYKGINSRANRSEIEIKKHNVLMIGPTGVGKTEFARQLAKIMKVPFAMGDATSMSAIGYVGGDPNSALLSLYLEANEDLEATQRGIVYLDEIDKIRRSGANVSITKDVSGECVQQCMLKMLEGTVEEVPPNGGRRHPEQKCLQIDTTNILFICGGAFNGIEDIVRKRLGRQSQIGFTAKNNTSDGQKESEKDELRAALTPEDLYEFGMIPEFVGRLPVRTTLNSLTETDLIRILMEPKNSKIRQYQALAAMDGVELEFQDDAIKEIARLAKLQKTGARALESIIEDFILELQFKLPEFSGSKIVITKKMVMREEEVHPIGISKIKAA